LPNDYFFSRKIFYDLNPSFYDLNPACFVLWLASDCDSKIIKTNISGKFFIWLPENNVLKLKKYKRGGLKTGWNGRKRVS